jgi:hypothetical protein
MDRREPTAQADDEAEDEAGEGEEIEGRATGRVVPGVGVGQEAEHAQLAQSVLHQQVSQRFLVRCVKDGDAGAHEEARGLGHEVQAQGSERNHETYRECGESCESCVG